MKDILEWKLKNSVKINHNKNKKLGTFKWSNILYKFTLTEQNSKLNWVEQ